MTQRELGPVYGIPGGGLFNEIFNAHLSERIEDISEASLNRAPAQQEYEDFEFQSLVKNEARWPWVGRFFVSFVITTMLVFCVFAPIGTKTNPMLPGTLFLLVIAPAIVFTLLMKFLNKKFGPSTDLKTTSMKMPKDMSQANAVYKHPSLIASRNLIYADQLNEEMVELFNEMNATENVPRYVNKDVAGFKLFYGAAAEISTSHALRTIPDATVYNDIELRNSNGTVSANIDHLVHVNGRVFMIDSKWWSNPPEFTRTKDGSLAVSLGCTHKRAVSTCIYEANFLPHTPNAIIFVIRGRAADQLPKPVTVINNYYRFIPSTESPQGFFSTPCPVIFVDYRRVADYIHLVANESGQGSRGNNNQLRESRFTAQELRSLPVTLELDFGLEKDFS